MEDQARLCWWVEGRVDVAGEHIVLLGEDFETAIARVAPAADGAFVVEFLVADDPLDSAAQRMLSEARRELDFYLLEVGGPDPWAYAIYHCGTAANLYSSLHWSLEPASEERTSPREAS